MPDLNLTDDERVALTKLVRDMIDGDHSPLSTRIRRLKALLAKLDLAPAPAAEPYPPTKAWVNSSIGQRKRRR